MLNLTTTVSGLSDSESLTVSSPMLPSLAISAHSLVQDVRSFIEELRTSLPEVSPANPSAPQGSALESMIPATCGPQLSNASASYDPDTRSWKTSQGWLLADISAPSWETWPKAGLIVDGVFYQQPNWERRISEIGSGLLPTPAAQEPGWTISGQVEIVDRNGNPPMHWNQRWYDKNTGRLVQKGVTQVAQMWPTPTAYDANGVKRTPEGWERRAAFRQSIGRDHIAPAGLSEQIWLEQNNIPLKISKWPTPTAVTDTGGAALCKWGGSGARQMMRNNGVTEQELNGALNPDWVEWLMGWPIGWSSLQPLSPEVFSAWFDGVCNGTWWHNEPDIPRIAKSVPNRTDRLKAIGNGQASPVVAAAWHVLSSEIFA